MAVVRHEAKEIAREASLRYVTDSAPAMCRTCYIHPRIMDAYLDGTLAESLKGRRNGSGLPPEEAAVLRLLRRELAGGSHTHK